MTHLIDYSNKEIIFYKFICNDPLIISSYVGHTIDFTSRKYQHKICCINEKSKFLLYKIIRENGGWDNWTMFEIERKIVASKQDALKHEQYLIDLQIHKLNMRNSIQNIESLIKYKKYRQTYYEQNKEQITIKKRTYYEQNKEHFKINGTKYREQNKEQIALKQKIWRKQNREQINLKKRELYYRKKEINLMSREDKH